MAQAKYKPLSFDTTMRNPERIAAFLKCLSSFEGQTLTNNVITNIVKEVIKAKLYCPLYVTHDERLKDIYESEESTFSDEQIEQIIENSPQHHKEAGYDEGWPSRFETWFNLPKEFGFVWYKIDETIEISKTGHMLIEALGGDEPDNKKIQNVFLNTMCKYQSANPFRKTLNNNIPLLLLLRVIKRMKEEVPGSPGISKQEISFFISWTNNDDEALFRYIKEFRNTHGVNRAAEEIVYNQCLNIMGYGESDKKYIKIDKIIGESVDEYIRKMKITGVLSLRGNGRFLDYNTYAQKKIDYILKSYENYHLYTDEREYFDYMNVIDNNLFDATNETVIDVSDVRKQKLYQLAKEYSKEKIYEELKLACSKKGESRDDMLKFINKPTRLEFLTSIALCQNFEGLDVNPNYAVDDEGLPTFTAAGGKADIECNDRINKEFVEVTLLQSKTDQVNNEMLSITRHQSDERKTNPNVYSVFVAPSVHEDAKRYVEWIKFKENIDIKAFDITGFIEALKSYKSLDNLVMAE